MNPFYVTVGKDIPLMIIPDSLAHVDGHPILTYSYSIYHDGERNAELQKLRVTQQHLEKKNDPGYMGTIVFETPGRSLNYIADGRHKLSAFEIKELVDKIDHYRENTSLWPRDN